MTDFNALPVPSDELIEAVRSYGLSCYRNGLYRGVLTIETIHGWLTRQPDTEAQREVRGWVEKLLNTLKDEVNGNGEAEETRSK